MGFATWMGAIASGTRESWATAISTRALVLRSRFSALTWAPSLAAESDKKLSQRNSTNGQGWTDSSNLLTIRLFQRMPELRKTRRKVAEEASAETTAWASQAGHAV
jgi:hypothetical protein